MAILQILLALLFRTLGRFMNTLFSWATINLFGRVPEKRQLYLSGIAFGSILWLVILLGVIFPGFATFLLSFIILRPETKIWIQAFMIVLAAGIPLLIGYLALSLVGGEELPDKPEEKLKSMLMGYSYVLGLSLTLLMMIAVVPVMYLENRRRGLVTIHVPVVIESKNYPTVIRKFEEQLNARGFPFARIDAPWYLRFPTQFLAFFTRDPAHQRLSRRLDLYRTGDCDMALHPWDCILTGPANQIYKMRMLVVGVLLDSDAYLTWSNAGNRFENRIKQKNESADKLEEALGNLPVAYEEWLILFLKLRSKA